MDYLFSPSAESLISRYLRSKIAGEPHDASSFMHDVDVYTDHPYELVRNRAPALGTGDGDGRIWYFFSPVRYVGGKNTSGRRGGSRKRSRTVGANGKLGTWHSEGKKKTMEGSAAGGYVENFSYHERTASGFVKPGWLMVEYGILEEDGGCNIVLCKVYKSPRGPGSDVPFPRTSASSGCKRKADVVEHLEAPRTPSFWPRQRTHGDDDDDCMLFADSLERDLSDDRAAPAYQESEPMSGGEPAAPAYQGTQHMSGGGEPSASAFQETEHVSGGEAQLAPSAGDLSGLPWLQQFMETDDDEVVIQLPHDFSYERYLLGDDQPGAVLPSAAQPEDAAVTCAQTSQHGPPEEDMIEFSLDELMGSSASGACSGLQNLITDEDDDDVMLCGLSCPPANDDKIEFMDAGVIVEELLASSTPGECSALQSPLTDDDVMLCGLACPPMDRACVEQLFSAPPERFDPSYVEELLSDL